MFTDMVFKPSSEEAADNKIPINTMFTDMVLQPSSGAAAGS